MDANVLSEAGKPMPEQRVLDWLDEHEPDLWISVITLGEIKKGILLLPRGRRRASLMMWFTQVQLRFNGKILAIDESVMEQWAILYAAAEDAGRRLPLFDSLLAATAEHHGLTVATRNVRDFPASTSVVNPWEA